MSLREHPDDLARRRARAGRMGGDEAVARQHAAGKLTVRGRIERLFDKDSLIDDVINPRERPWRKHGVVPV
jgi:methylmalonyl-CoA decarboxylase subunit alpha